MGAGDTTEGSAGDPPVSVLCQAKTCQQVSARDDAHCTDVTLADAACSEAERDERPACRDRLRLRSTHSLDAFLPMFLIISGSAMQLAEQPLRQHPKHGI